MRRRDREVTEHSEIMHILDSGKVLHLGLVNRGVFLEQLLALNREDYINILNCIVAYNASVRLLSEDISLAYSMLVYCLESLA